MIRAIFNADDFGISPEVNDAICRCFEEGIITGTTLMVNMPFAADAMKLAGQHGFSRKVGLHLNLTAGMPLTARIRSFPVFCDGDGRFNAAFHLSTARRLCIGRAESRALYEEIEAQIQRFRVLVPEGSHMDSHHHSHTDLSVWKVALPLLKKYGFGSVRLGRDLYGRQKAGLFNRCYKKYYNSLVRKNGLAQTDHFGSFSDLTGSFESLEEGTLLEVMLHPMYGEDGRLMDTDTPMDEIRDFMAGKQIAPECYSFKRV